MGLSTRCLWVSSSGGGLPRKTLGVQMVRSLLSLAATNVLSLFYSLPFLSAHNQLLHLSAGWPRWPWVFVKCLKERNDGTLKTRKWCKLNQSSNSCHEEGRHRLLKNKEQGPDLCLPEDKDKDLTFSMFVCGDYPQFSVQVRSMNVIGHWPLSPVLADVWGTLSRPFIQVKTPT